MTWSALALSGLGLAAVPAQEAPAPVERTGTFVPARSVEVKIDLDAYSGPLEFVEVAAHGSSVREGDVLARFELTAIDEAIESAERDLRSTEIRHQNSREQARLDAEAGEARLEDANEAVADAELALSMYEKTEVELKKRGNELSESNFRDNLEDQKDELAQLEKMYTADELTDATEEIVLKRSRRQLARSEAQFKLQQSRRQFEAEYADQQQLKAKREAVKDARRNRDRVLRQLEIEKRARDDAQSRLEPEMKNARKKVEELRRDREKLIVRAARAGVVLHGAVDDYKPGRTAPRHETGGTANAKAKLFTIAQPGEFAVALDVTESLVLKLNHGMAVKVVPSVDGEMSMMGRLRYDRFPTPKSAGGPENTYDGMVELDGAPPALVPGMRCKVVIELPRKSAP